MNEEKPAKNCVLILGATSAIARAIANAFAKAGHDLYLAARDKDELSRLSSDMQIRYGVKIYTAKFDIEDIDSHETFFQNVIKTAPTLAGVVFAMGYMTDNNVRKILAINLTNAICLLEQCADYLSAQKSGFIIGISSVAGDRGRQSNYLYGAAKGGFSIYLQGLRNRLYKSNIRVITVKPGFVDTAMTFGLPGLFLVASPDSVGQVIYNSLKKSADIIYVPWFWRYIMLIIKNIPEFIFKKLSL